MPSVLHVHEFRVGNQLQEAVNILELSHQRIFTNLPAKGLSLDVECETRDRDHLQNLLGALRAAGYEVAPIEVA